MFLLHGKDPSEGILHIVHNNELGTVCDDHFDNFDAAIVCRQLGYAGGKMADIADFKYAGKGRIWLDEVVCLDNEQSIADCKHNPWGVSGCDHKEDVAIICSKGSLFFQRQYLILNRTHIYWLFTFDLR